MCHWHDGDHFCCVNDYRGDHLFGVNDAAKTISAVSMTQQKLSLRCQWRNRNYLCGVNDLHGVTDMTEIIAPESWDISAVSLTPGRPNMLKQISRQTRSHIWNSFNPLVRGLGVIDWWKKNKSKHLVILWYF
jgi:hypothetical protein